MLTFYIHYNGVYWWTCYAGNHTEIFKHTYDRSGNYPVKLRNCVNHIHSIGKHLRHYVINVTLEANTQRLRQNEPLYGCYVPTERNHKKVA